jgi:hypothetical protein
VFVCCGNTVYICAGLKMFFVISNEYIWLKIYIHIEELTSLVFEVDLYNSYGTWHPL